MVQVNLSCECVCVALSEFASVAYMQCTNTRVYKVNENRFQIHSFWRQEDGIMDYDCLAGWQPPINMSDTFLDCLSTCLVASRHTFCQSYLSAAMYPVACVSTLAKPSLAVLYVLLSSYVQVFTSAWLSLSFLSHFPITSDCFLKKNLLLVFLIFYLHWPTCPM